MNYFKFIKRLLLFIFIEICVVAGLIVYIRYNSTLNDNTLANYLQTAQHNTHFNKFAPIELIEEVDILSNTYDYMVDDKLTYIKQQLNRQPDDVKVIVDIPEQHAYIKFRDGKFRLFVVSTGDPSKHYEMDEAVRLIISKRDSGLTPIYGPRLLLMGRFKKDGSYYATTLALHGTNTPQIIGEPKSLGCVYFKNDDILKIYPELQIGDIVVTLRRE